MPHVCRELNVSWGDKILVFQKTCIGIENTTSEILNSPMNYNFYNQLLICLKPLFIPLDAKL